MAQRKPGGTPGNETTNCRSSSTSVSIRFYASDGHSTSLTKNYVKEPGRSPSLTPSREESGDGLDIPYAERKRHPPSIGLEPTGETEERNTMFDMEKNTTS